MNPGVDLPLTDLEVFSHPFPYFTATQGFRDALSASLLDWLESEAPWKLVETDFYEQYEFSLYDAQRPSHLKFITAPRFLERLRLTTEQIFGARLRKKPDCTAHKLVPGQRIRIHNDFLPGQETHRVLVQLNRGWNEDQGGFLMFFNSQDPADVYRLFPPLHNTVVGFAISPDSNHAVSTIHGGGRFTLVFSFYGSSDR
jgi:Rps23 Pro-64 3,4-dihydroxylase Tpa1-like proline 4-hydroxylase